MNRATELPPIPFGQQVVNRITTALRMIGETFTVSEQEIEAAQIRKQASLYGRKGPHQDRFYNYDTRRLEHTYVNQVLARFVHSLQRRDGNDQVVLDLGTGAGEAADYFEEMGLRTIRLDLSLDGLQGQPNAVIGPAWSLPFPDGAFQGVHSKDMLTHIPSEFRSRLFSELARVTERDGRILISSANFKSRAYHQYPTSSHETCLLATASGLGLVDERQWTPHSFNRDWYNFPVMRFVLTFNKLGGS